MAKIQYKEVFTAKGGVPTLKLVIPPDENDPESYEGYLTPFRCYRFQVSKDVHGSGDYGSSAVIGLKHIMTIRSGEKGPGWQSSCNLEETCKELLLGQAMIAIANWAAGMGAVMAVAPTRRENFVEKTLIGQFIDQCYDWIKSV